MRNHITRSNGAEIIAILYFILASQISGFWQTMAIIFGWLNVVEAIIWGWTVDRRDR